MSRATEWPLVRASVRKGTDANRNETESHRALQAMKRRVPEIVSRVGRDRWRRRVDTLPQGLFRLDTREVASRAYHKMHELMETCALPFPTASLHLCEAPGGFVQWLACHHPNPTAWTWTALSIADGPSFCARLLPVDRGRVLEGNVLDVDRWTSTLDAGGVDMVTADGAVAMDHDDIEREHLDLLWGQTLVALHCLAVGGTFVIKFFEGGTYETQLYLARMTTLFRDVSILKPLTSRATNSERYLVCRGRLPVPATRDDDQTQVVSSAWLDDTRAILSRLSADQTRALQRVLDDLDGPRSRPPSRS